jgi:Electron transfer DM13
MAPKKSLIVAVVLVGLVGAWYFFRPERAWLNRRADEPAPSAVTRVLRRGEFMSRAHQGRGQAEVLELTGGERVLRLSDFSTSDGPDLEVYLLGSADVARRADLDKAGYLSLGPLKGNIGPQNYVIPAGVDIERYGAVAVWCRRFGVNFTSASLTPIAMPGT